MQKNIDNKLYKILSETLVFQEFAELFTVNGKYENLQAHLNKNSQTNQRKCDNKSAQELLRELRVNDSPFYNWKQLYEGIEVCDVKKIKKLGVQNSHLRKMFANLSLSNKRIKGTTT